MVAYTKNNIVSILEINSWYNFTNGEYHFYSQLEKIEENHFYFKNRFYIVNGKANTGDYIELKILNNIRLVTNLSEYQQYLPETHPDFHLTKVYELW